jgi:hypothetical protein
MYINILLSFCLKLAKQLWAKIFIRDFEKNDYFNYISYVRLACSKVSFGTSTCHQYGTRSQSSSVFLSNFSHF